MPSSRRRADPRREMYLSLASQIESQLRDAYVRKHDRGELTQSSIAEKLGVNRSAVHHRLMGRTNMTIETIADMVWALDHDIVVDIFDPDMAPPKGNYYREKERDEPVRPRAPPTPTETDTGPVRWEAAP